MGYDIYIGEAVARHDDDDEQYTAVDEVSLEGAPPDPRRLGGHTNSWHPSYRSYVIFGDEMGLCDLLDEFVAEHPGHVTLTKAHLDRLQLALVEADVRMEREEIEEQHLLRLRWLVWWVDWALKSCVSPTIYNH